MSTDTPIALARHPRGHWLPLYTADDLPWTATLTHVLWLDTPPEPLRLAIRDSTNANTNFARCTWLQRARNTG